MWKKNSKVPVAILSCFLIAFILQGILKLSGVFIFEKALDWEIFKVIDNSKVLYIIFNIIIAFCGMYCLSFSFLDKAYSKKWYHYVVLVAVASFIIIIRILINLSFVIHIILDILAYVIVPFIIHITSNKQNKVFDNSIFGIITTLTINLFLYFAYLGLSYWSNLLNSLLPINPVWTSSSAMFLIQFEMYIGLAMVMLSTNILIKFIKGDRV